MKFMSQNKIFAVVDLETTGTSVENSDRIIQFSCDFVKNDKVVNHFSTYINPGVPISKEVQELTGIKNKDVKNAPYFDEVAGMIYAMLQNTIFVAHNVGFDYNFLCSELERVGYPEIDLLSIDTVQLSQIIFPDLFSYRLSDISESLGIRNDNPHQADNDTAVTAQLLIKLKEKAMQFPLLTLQHLSKMGKNLTADTGLFFEEIYKLKSKDEEKLASNLMTIDNLVIQRPIFNTSKIQPQEFPAQRDEKNLIFDGKITLRNEQVKFMDDIYKQLNDNFSNVTVFDAPTGLGKTLGYLLPAAYASTSDARAVISTATTTLQDQMMNSDIKLLQSVLPFDLNILNVKGSHHYIDLEKFNRTLYLPQSKGSNLLQMRILVWLLQTKTGDLEELNIIEKNNAFLMDVRHLGLGSIDKSSKFSSVDFVKRQQLFLENSNLIITNHAYLLSHVQDFANEKTSLIIDEAHHLGDNLIQNNKDTIDFDDIKILSDTILVKMQSHINTSFRNLVDIQFLSEYEYFKLLEPIQKIDHTIEDIREIFMKYLPADKGFINQALPMNKLRGIIKGNLALFKEISLSITEYQELNKVVLKRFIEFVKEQRLTNDEVHLLNEYQKLTTLLFKQLKMWSKLDLANLEETSVKNLIWLTYANENTSHLKLNFSIFDGRGFLTERLYNHFKNVSLIGANLGKNVVKNYTFRFLDLNEDTPVMKYQPIFSYNNQSKTFVIEDIPNFTKLTQAQAADIITDNLVKILNTTDKKTMVLFNSLEMIDQVYSRLIHKFRGKREILAQGNSGSNERIKKRFLMPKLYSPVLLGAGTFWEGIDLPKDNLEMLVIVRLPFSSPTTLFNQVRNQQLKAENKNFFTEYSLPEAIFKLQQGWGRLLRTKEDRGVCIILDSRLISKSYGKEFERAFPRKVKIHRIKSDDISREINNFFNK